MACNWDRGECTHLKNVYVLTSGKNKMEMIALNVILDKQFAGMGLWPTKPIGGPR